MFQYEESKNVFKKIQRSFVDFGFSIGFLKNKERSIPNFSEEDYVLMYPDVRAAVKNGEFKDGLHHYLRFGEAEGRFTSLHDRNQTGDFTKRSTIASHSKIWAWIGQNANKADIDVLEIGSRAVASNAMWKTVIPECNYTGFDVMEGPNVDVVGDAHRLSEYFPDKKFDLIISFAVFEHLAMPWLVSQEIARLLKNGGKTVHETHFSYSEHELPWHFFQFNSNALEVLFCRELGFETIDSGLDNPIDGKFSQFADDYLAGQNVYDLYCHSSIIAEMKNKDALSSFQWVAVADRLKNESMYPSESGKRWISEDA